MPPFQPPRILREAALLDVAVAETFRGETIWAAFDSAKKSANAHTATAKKLTVAARRLENAADGCLLEAKAEKKRSKRYYHQLKGYSANPVVNVEPAVRDDKTEHQKKGSWRRSLPCHPGRGTARV